MEAIEQFVIDHGAGNDDFRTPQTDAFNFSPFVYGQASQALGEPRHFRPGDDGALAGTVFAKIAGGGGKRGGGSGGGDYVLNFAGDHARCDAVDFAGDESLQPFEFAFARWIMAEEFVGESDRAQGKTDGFTNLTAGGDGQFAASSAQIHHQSRRIVDAQVGDEAQVNQASFFQAGNDFDRPAGRRAHPLDKCLRVAGVAQGAGGDHSDRVGDYLLGCAILSRTELEPISTAAKVGMRQGQFTCRMGLRHHKAKGKILNPGDTGYTDAQCSFVADCSGAFDGGDILF